MIKYYLVENYLSKSENKFMALVSNPETRNPDDIITHMIDEGTGLTGVFLDGWINRVRDLKFTLSLLILVLSMATTACRSRNLHNSVPVATPQVTSISTRVRRFRYATADTTAGTVLQRSSTQQPTGRQPPPVKPETGNTRTSGRGSALSWVVWIIAGLLVVGVAFKLYRRN